jgi:hypothetical protein
MLALLGKIISIIKIETSETTLNRYEIKFKAACMLPSRSAAPEWLKDQILSITRDVCDLREIGHPGDSIVLSSEESIKWLNPLNVIPNIISGVIPDSIRIDLKWWKDDKTPEYSIRANAVSMTGKLEKSDDRWYADIPTSDFFPANIKLPIDIEVMVDKIKTVCSILPIDEPWTRKLYLPEGERHRLDNKWYALDIVSHTFGGGISAIKEKGRGVDHFRAPNNQIGDDLELAGHIDVLIQGGWERGSMMRTPMSCAGYYYEGDSSRACFEGVVDEGKGIRSSVTYTLFDDLPIILVDRKFQFNEPKKSNDLKANEAPKEMIDNLIPIACGFRPGWIVDRSSDDGSRLICMDEKRLAEYRPAKICDPQMMYNIKISSSWMLIEHPIRGESMLYLIDKKHIQYVAMHMNNHSVFINTASPVVPLMPNSSIGFMLGISTGELCGASTDGAWVASRIPIANGIQCVVVCSLNQPKQADAVLSVGDQALTIPMTKAIIPGIGTIYYAIQDFLDMTMSDSFDVTAAGIPSRRTK